LAGGDGEVICETLEEIFALIKSADQEVQ